MGLGEPSGGQNRGGGLSGGRWSPRYHSPPIPGLTWRGAVVLEGLRREEEDGVGRVGAPHVGQDLLHAGGLRAGGQHPLGLGAHHGGASCTGAGAGAGGQDEGAGVPPPQPPETDGQTAPHRAALRTDTQISSCRPPDRQPPPHCLPRRDRQTDRPLRCPSRTDRFPQPPDRQTDPLAAPGQTAALSLPVRQTDGQTVLPQDGQTPSLAPAPDRQTPPPRPWDGQTDRQPDPHTHTLSTPGQTNRKTDPGLVPQDGQSPLPPPPDRQTDAPLPAPPDRQSPAPRTDRPTPSAARYSRRTDRPRSSPAALLPATVAPARPSPLPHFRRAPGATSSRHAPSPPGPRPLS